MDKWLKVKPQIAKKRKLSEEDTQSTPSKKSNNLKNASDKSKEKIRLYDVEYLSIGFIYSGDVNKPRPLCVICSEQLSNGSMKRSNLKRHFDTKHGNLKDKPLEFFERRKND